jgi:hypothetical protein
MSVTVLSNATQSSQPKQLQNVSRGLVLPFHMNRVPDSMEKKESCRLDCSLKRYTIKHTLAKCKMSVRGLVLPFHMNRVSRLYGEKGKLPQITIQVYLWSLHLQPERHINYKSQQFIYIFT